MPLHARYLTDRASALTMEQISRLRELLRRFEQKFPQSVFSVFVTDLPAGTSVGEFTFWLANRALFGSATATGEENFDLLLVIEADTGNAALTVGYGLENLILEDDLNLVLAAALPALRSGQLERGIRLCVEEMTRQLSDISQATMAGPKTLDAPIEERNW